MVQQISNSKHTNNTPKQRKVFTPPRSPAQTQLRTGCCPPWLWTQLSFQQLSQFPTCPLQAALNPWTCQSLHSSVQQLFQASLHPLHKKERFIVLIGLLWWRSIRSNPLDWDQIRATIKVNSKMLQPHHNYQRPSWQNHACHMQQFFVISFWENIFL